MSLTYECIGGPLDGTLIRRSPDGFGAFCWVDMDKDGEVVMHFYRMCVNKQRLSERVKTARFWHYIGTNPDVIRRPTLRAPRRLYK